MGCRVAWGCKFGSQQKDRRSFVLGHMSLVVGLGWLGTLMGGNLEFPLALAALSLKAAFLWMEFEVQRWVKAYSGYV